MPPQTSVVISTFGRWDLTHCRLSELWAYAPDDTEIVVIDDAHPSHDTEKGVNWWQTANSRHDILYHRNETNLGFGGSMNLGAAMSHGKNIVLLSNDVVCRGDFISEINKHIERNPKSLVGGEIIDWAGGWNEIPVNGHKVIVPYLGGWLLACTREAWMDLGGFDPLYGRFDYEDLDISLTAMSKGYELIPLRLPQILTHLSGQTIGTLHVDRQAKTIENRQKFIDKWSDKLPKIHEMLLKSEVANERIIGERV